MKVKTFRLKKNYYKNSYKAKNVSHHFKESNKVKVTILGVFNFIIFTAIAPFIYLMLIFGAITAKFDPRATFNYDFYIFHKKFKGRAIPSYVVKYYAHRLGEVPESVMVNVSESWGRM